MGVIMTGMSDDAARGLLEMKQAGAFTVVRTKPHAWSFGMPAEAIKLRAVERVLPLGSIPAEILRYCR